MGIGCGVLVMVSSIFFYFYHSYRHTPVVKTLLAQRGDLIQSVSASGVVVAKDPVMVEAKVSGKIKEVVVEDGQEVKKGDLLIEIEEEQLNKQIDAAKAQLATAKANLSRLQGGSSQQGIESSKLNLSQAKIALEEAERNLKSTKMLYDAKAIAKEQLNLAEAQVEKAKLSHENARLTVLSDVFKTLFTFWCTYKPRPPYIVVLRVTRKFFNHFAKIFVKPCHIGG